MIFKAIIILEPLFSVLKMNSVFLKDL